MTIKNKNKNDNMKPTPLIAGVYYLTADNNIIYSYGFTETCLLAYDDNNKSYKINLTESSTLKLLNKVQDFPNAKNPKLPYEFDLNWDIKRSNELAREIDNPALLSLLRSYIPKNTCDLSNPNNINWSQVKQYFRDLNNKHFFKCTNIEPSTFLPNKKATKFKH